ncbi:hypothetical protein [Methanocella arvoryzae]|uniref:Uncharacterized protein n=1 Tax=Methanocella arvoryzae (strain DSM 22066 / NBRC 105507 / MRE50) TaxID=351160 RepID=Q0W250_METAR|nr:hypothetical protein [Methanocella arvoryzae]CAJ37543.1 hypothetical protein RCIX2465 [Methanocella arvoryzae MRE50]
MKWKLSIWSVTILILMFIMVIVLVLNLFGIIQLETWGIFGAVVTVFCLWLLARLFFSGKAEEEPEEKE